MPVQVRKIRGKYRIVLEDTRKIAKSKHGNPSDGGGHNDKAKAVRQAGYINNS